MLLFDVFFTVSLHECCSSIYIGSEQQPQKHLCMTRLLYWCTTSWKIISTVFGGKVIVIINHYISLYFYYYIYYFISFLFYIFFIFIYLFTLLSNLNFYLVYYLFCFLLLFFIYFLFKYLTYF